MATREVTTRRSRVFTPHGKKGAALILVLVMIFSSPAIAGLIQLMGQSGTNSGSLQGHESITSMISEVWGWNGTTWKAATLTLNAASYQVQAVFANGFAAKEIIFVTGNSSYNAEHLLEHSYIFSTTTATITTTGHGNLSALYQYVGAFTNSSSVTSVGDKAVAGSVVNQTLYSSTTNQLGKAVEYDMLQLFGTPGSYKPMFVAYLSGINLTSAEGITLALTAYWSYPFEFNLVHAEVYSIMAVFLISAIITGFIAIPKVKGMSTSDRRAHSYGFREREVGGVAAALVIGVMEFLILGIFGAKFPEFGGYGGAIAGFEGLALGCYIYSMNRFVGRYDIALATGLILSILLIFANMFLFFGSSIYVMAATYSSFEGEVAAAIFGISMLALLIESFVVTKRADLV